LNIFFPDIHTTLTKNFSKSLELLGHKLVLPSKDYRITQYPPQNWAWNDTHSIESTKKYDFAKGTIYVNKDELFEIKPDVIFVTAFENQFEVLNEIWPEAKKWGAKLVFYSGNDYWDTAYPWDLIQNYLPADQLAASICEERKVNFIHYRPWIDYDEFSFGGSSDSNILGTYICNYKENFPEDFFIYEKIKKLTPELLSLKLCESCTKRETAQIMKESFATLHIKKLEGYGFAIIESMARGRPVFFWEPSTINKSYLKWLELGVTGFTFRDMGDFLSQIKFLLSNKEFLFECQEKCAKRIRELINNEEQNEKLNNFLQNLI
tara:strand:+ start:510 stop:1472 length:963 start_codon:yes stop_codon:yes gene_type:complete